MEIDKRTYNKVHQWNLRNWIKSGICELCTHKKKTQWANKTGRYLLGVRDDWMELCSSCHYLYDQKTFGRVHPNGKKYRLRLYDADLQKSAIAQATTGHTQSLRNIGTKFWLNEHYAEKGGYLKFRELHDNKTMKRDIAIYFGVDSRQVLNWEYFDYPEDNS